MQTAENNKLGIKETLEVIAGLKVLGEFVAKVGADGKVNTKDVPHLISLVKNAGTLSEAVKDAGEVKAEAQDLTQEELAQIGLKALEMVKAIRAAAVLPAANAEPAVEA